MIRPASRAARRQKLSQALPEPVLLMGHKALPRNYPANQLPFRQDSTFLYYTGCSLPGAAALLTPEDGLELYIPDPHEDDDLWHGPTPSAAVLGQKLGAEQVRPISTLASRLAGLRAAGRTLHTVPVAEPQALAELQSWTGQHLVCGAVDAASGGGSEALLDSIIAQRLIKEPEELDEIRAGMEVTREAHRLARELSRPGQHERQIARAVVGTFIENDCTEAYSSIISVRGEVLHCREYVNQLEEGQLLLIDAGAEGREGYATDITRTFPVSGRFDPFQRDVYALVLRAQEAGIAMCVPGESYRDIHLETCRVLAEGLVDLGLLRGKPEDLVESGAHALFFPHGVGHLLGLDVHDMEGYGDRAGYAPGRRRSPQFGTAYLRMDRDLEPGMVVTIEPGLYFVPAILQRQSFRDRFAEQVDFQRAEKYLRFGGIRIEDDVAITEDRPDVLSRDIPKSISEVERAS